MSLQRKCRSLASLGMTSALAVIARVAEAQARPCAPCAAHIAASDSAFSHLDAKASLDHALAGLRADSNNVELVFRAARGELVLGILANERGVVDGHLANSAAYARRAVALAPNDAWSHFWLASAQGRRSLRAGFRTALPLASETYTEAMKALAIDSTHAGAHEIIGKLHSEVRKLPWVVRKLAAVMSSLDVARNASWETSELQIKRAIALDPTLVIAYADLSQLYLRTNRRNEAIAVVEQLEKVPRRTPVDEYFQVEARRRLGWY